MSWSDVFLAAIAAATLIMAVVQVGVAVVLARTAKDAQRTLASVQQEVRPLITRATAVVEEASRTAALATTQAQKVDRLLTDLSQRIDETAATVQMAIVTPAREGLAILAAVKAGLAALRGFRDVRHSRHAEEEDPLFIG